ncbi:amidohydrolase, partial [Streptomyces sp. NPDC048845]
VRNVLFASEMIGAVRDIDPCSGHHFDHTRRYVEAAGLSAGDLAAVQEHNARAVYPRLDALLNRQGR